MRQRRGLVLLLLALSGASGLIYEVVWVRLLSALLGGTTFAIGAVLASFMGGLAAGSHALGRRADRVARPLRLYAWLEIGVALWGGGIPFLLAALQPAYVVLAQALPGAALGPARLLLAFVLLLPPTFAMGGTLPVLARFLVRGDDRLGRDLGVLYAVNTFGAMGGVLAAGFFLVPALGLHGSTAIAVAGNLVAAAMALALRPARAQSGETPGPAPARRLVPGARAPSRPGPVELHAGLLAGVFALTGFAALGFELYWTRGLHHFLGNTTFAFATMLGTFLFGLAGGGWLGGLLADRVAAPARALGWLLLGIAVAAATTVPMLWNALPHLERAEFFSAPALGWSSYVARRFLAAAAVMALPTVLAGMVFPLVNRIGISNLARLGAGLGKLYAANTLGAIAGSVAAAWWLLPWLGVRDALLATALLVGALGVLVLWANGRRRGRDTVLGGIALAGLVALVPNFARRAGALPSDTQEPQDKVVFQRVDATAETRVYEKPNGELHMSVDGRHIGGTEPLILRKEKLLAHVPIAVAPRLDRVLAVGLGSGISLGTFALYDEVVQMVCVEIVPGVIDGAAAFRAHHGDVLADPRLRLLTGDGVQYLLTTTERFDVISSDSKLNPEYAGNGSILSREYYELCRQRLTPDGVMVQWLSAHIPLSVVRIVTRTFLESFPHVELFWIDPGEILMAGSAAPIAFDFQRWRRRSAAAAVRADLEEQGLFDPYVLATSRVAGRARLAAALADAPLNTMSRPTYEFRVVRDFRLKSQGYHENDNLRWLAGLWSPDDFRLLGNDDSERLARFRDSSYLFLLGFTSGGGTERLAGGRPRFAAGLARNPDDPRLQRALQRLDAEAAAAGAEPRSASGWLRHGLAALDAGHLEAALTAFDQALVLDRDRVEAAYNRLLVLRRLGRQASTRAALAGFTRDFPGDARGWSLLGESLGEQGDLEGSLAALRHAVALDPSTASFWNNLAVTLGRMGRPQEAAAAFVRVHELDPLFPDAAYYAAASYSLAGRPREAAMWMELCLERRLCDPSRFRDDALFENLRRSRHWQPERIEGAARDWNAGRVR